jgi:hypothetical protein
MGGDPWTILSLGSRPTNRREHSQGQQSFRTYENIINNKDLAPPEPFLNNLR